MHQKLLVEFSCDSHNNILLRDLLLTVTNFIQLVFSQLVDRFSQTKLRWKAPNEGYLHMCRMHKSDNK